MDRIFVALVFLLPVPTFGLMAWVTRTLGVPDLSTLVGSPLWWGLQIVVTAGAVVVALRGVARFPGRLASAAEVEAAQKGLVVFPKLVLAGGLVYGLVIAGLVALCVPAAGARWGELLIVGYSNAIFFSMPPYILFLQRFERRNRSVPFSERHLSMNIPLRVSLVSAFVLTSMLAALLVAFHNLGTTAGQDTWSAVLAVGLPIGVVGLAVGLMNLGLLMRGIVERIEGARAFVGALAEGQVAQRPLEMSSRDELGVLSHRLNLVQRSLGELLGHTRDSVDRTVDVKDELMGICGAATEEVGRIGHLVRRTDERFEHILAQSAEVLTRVERFHGLSADLNGEVTRQIEMVEDTSSALTQMTEAIEEVARLSASRVEAAQALEAKTADGGRQMTGTLGQLNEIATSVQDIRAITGLIQTIAAQTNLLAMNAAIEAAHAGSAGAGFAVVADEIRKLAENAARNSREITQKVKSIVQNIGTTVEAGRRTSDTFAELNAELGDFLKYFRSIESAVGDMRAGSQSILTVSATLQAVSAGVEQRASAVDQEADGLFKDMEALASDARQAREAMTEVDASVGQVTEAAGRLKDHSQRLDASTRDVSDQVGRFRLE